MNGQLLCCYMMLSKDHHLPIVEAGPIPIVSISGTIAALPQAPKQYCTKYFPAMTSVLFLGKTSVKKCQRQFNSTKLCSYQNSPAQYVLTLANAKSRPTPQKKADTIGSARPPASYCNPQPYTKDEAGITKKNEIIPLFNRSCGKRRPPLMRIHFRTVMSENLPPTIVPTRNPIPGAR